MHAHVKIKNHFLLPMDSFTRLYRHLDWSRCLVGGSYALHQFTGATTWQPHDVDVPCKVDSVAEFERLLADFMEKSGARLIEKEIQTPETRKEATALNGRDERFHDSILVTCTLNVPTVSLPVQLVGITTGKHELLAHLNNITDLPACVSFRVMEDGQRMFHVPERGLRALSTKVVSSLDICPARLEKYKARGYTFE